MALSMDEQRVLAEIERRLSAEDPGLAARLSSFRRPSPTARFRTTRAILIGSLLGIAIIAAVSAIVFTMMPLRAHTYRPATTQLASNRPATSAQVRNGPAASTISKPSTNARTSGVNSPTPNTASQP